MYDDVSAVIVLEVVYTSPTKSSSSANSGENVPRLDFRPKLDHRPASSVKRWIQEHLRLAYSGSRLTLLTLSP